jgi:flagellar hook-associated protein 1 FlgK
MSSNLLSIASSGALAASAALDVTAQNIANVGTPGYVKRGVATTELVGASAGQSINDISMFGVGPTSVTRNVSAFQQAEARRTNSAAVSADTQVTSLTDIQSALEQTNLNPSITGFETSLQQLTSNPTDSALRTGVLSAAQDMAQTFNLASTQLAAAGQGMQLAATDGVSQLNQLAANLAAVNVKISADSDPAANQAPLLDQRDALLQKMSQYADITTTIAPNQTVQVQIGGASGPQLVSGGTAGALAMATAANGTISFTLNGSAINLSGGSLAGLQQSLATLATTNASLDTIASSLITAANTAQTGGVALDGSAGQPLFTGTSAATIAVGLASGAQLATAPAGAGANSLDPTNLTALRNAIQAADPAGQTSNLLFAVSSTVQNATTTQTALDAIAANAQTALDAASGVNLDQEAANLLRYQQAYQASGKVMATAQTLFNSLLQNLNGA